jgi:putative ABC transport system permease protein
VRTIVVVGRLPGTGVPAVRNARTAERNSATATSTVMPPRGSIAWRKVRRDLWLARGRVMLLVVAVALSLTAVGAVLGAYGILVREMPRSFLSTHPASATFEMAQGVDPTLLAAVRRQLGVADAELRAMVRARVEVGPDRRLPLSLFVVEDFDAMRVETVSRLGGASRAQTVPGPQTSGGPGNPGAREPWPPATGAMLLDRSSAALLNAQIGATMTVSTANGVPRSVQVAGVVFDGGVAPAWQEQTGYAYITPATLAWLGDPPELDLLKVAFKDVPLDAAVIGRKAQELSAWLGQQGATVEEIRIPPPGQHPHQRLMNELAAILLLFGVLALTLSGLLVTTMISAMLARHVRQIGAMKAFGAQPGNVGVMYGATVAAIGAAAAAVAILPSVLAGQQLAAVYADLSNVALASQVIPWWVYAVVALAGVLTPLLAASVPVASASRMTVREAISEAGMYQGPTSGPAPSDGGVAKRVAVVLGPTLVLALRHAVRGRRRLALSLILLAVGGGAFMSGQNVAAASDRKLESGITMLGYDLELNLSQAQQTDALLRLVRSVPGVAYVEPVGLSNVAPVQPGEVPVLGTHKDGGHGTVRLYSLPADTHFQPAVQSGRWLEPSDVDAIVVAPSELERLAPSWAAPSRCPSPAASRGGAWWA